MTTKQTYTLPPSTPLSTALANSTFNYSGYTKRWSTSAQAFWEAAFMSIKVTSSLEAVLIIVINLFLLTLIVSSPMLRSRMRNHFVISVVVANFIVGLLSAPFTVDSIVRRGWVHGCYTYIILTLLTMYVQNFVSMWGIVALLLHYIARLLRYEGPIFVGRLPPLVQKLIPGLLIASPWIAAITVMVPIVFAGLNTFVWKVLKFNSCPMIVEKWAVYVLNTLVYFIPAIIIVALVVVIILLYRNQAERKEDQARLESGLAVMSNEREELESCWVHVAVALVTVAMFAPEHIYQTAKFNMRGTSVRGRIIASVFVHLLSDMTPAIVGILWLILLPDVRARVVELLGMLIGKLPASIRCCTARSPPAASGATSIPPVAFRDLHDE